jgi:hypothetical protein
MSRIAIIALMAGLTALAVVYSRSHPSCESDFEPIDPPPWAVQCPDGTAHSRNDPSFKGCPVAPGAPVRIAQTVKTVPVRPVTTQYKIFPSPEYDHYYEGDLTIKIVDTLEELRDVCQLDGAQLLACSTHNDRSCIIVMVKDEVMRTRSWTTGMLLRHEMGHCNGWGADHAGERSVTWPTTHWAYPNERVRLPTPRPKSAFPDMTVKAKTDKAR